MLRQYNRQAEIIIRNLSFHSDKFDFEFDVEFTDQTKKNHAEVKIYNLSHNTINRFRHGNPLIINAGYENDVGSVFVGAIYEISTEQNGVDRETTIKAVDGTNQRDKFRVNKTYKEGIKASQIITDLCRIIGLPIAVLSLPKDIQYRQGKHVSGVVLQRLKSLAKDCGAKFNISKGMAYFRKPGEGDDIGFVFSPERGLIGSPEPFVDEDEDGKEIRGYNIKALLNHRIQADTIIRVQSSVINGRYRVRKGRHIFTESEMITEMEVVT